MTYVAQIGGPGDRKGHLRPKGLERAVKAGARGRNVGIAIVGPFDEIRHCFEQGLAERRTGDIRRGGSGFDDLDGVLLALAIGLQVTAALQTIATTKELAAIDPPRH